MTKIIQFQVKEDLIGDGPITSLYALDEFGQLWHAFIENGKLSPYKAIPGPKQGGAQMEIDLKGWNR